MTYIMITEDGQTYQSNIVTEDDKNACDDGYLDVINTELMRKYYKGEWHALEVWGNLE